MGTRVTVAPLVASCRPSKTSPSRSRSGLSTIRQTCGLSGTSASRQSLRRRRVVFSRCQEFPAHRRTATDRAAHAHADQALEIFRRQAEAWTDDSQIALRQGIAGGKILGHVQRTAEDLRLVLFF